MACTLLTTTSFLCPRRTLLQEATFESTFDCSSAKLGKSNFDKVTALDFVCNTATDLSKVKNIEKLTLIKDDDERLKPGARDADQPDNNSKCCSDFTGRAVHVSEVAPLLPPEHTLESDGYERIAMPFFQSFGFRAQYFALRVDSTMMNTHKVRNFTFFFCFIRFCKHDFCAHHPSNNCNNLHFLL